jgi:ribosome modulation factor
MTLPKTLLDFERGFDDYNRGLRMCPFTVSLRVECWLDGWKTAQDNRMRG